MPKFYAQSGPVRVVLTADTYDRAALVFADHAVEPHLWIFEDSDLSSQERIDHLMLEALLHLEGTVRISERGFDRDDTQQFSTSETLRQWYRLITGIQCLCDAVNSHTDHTGRE